MWKFHDFSITDILREINNGESSSAEGPRDEIISPWKLQFIPRGEIDSLKGATTQFFLTVG